MTDTPPIDLARRLDAFGCDGAGCSAFPAVARAIRRHAPAALTQLYRHIAQTPALRRLFATPARMDHARDRQLEHWQRLFSGRIDQSYVDAADRIGRVHARVGLAPTWYIGGYARMLDHVLPRLLRARFGIMVGGGGRAKAAAALVRTSLIDMDIALSTYFAAEQAGRRAVIERCQAAFERMAQGDLTGTLDGLPPEYQALSDSFEAMRAQMSATLQAVTRSGHQIRDGSGHIRKASEDLSQRTEQQAASLEETAAAMEQLTVTVRQNAHGASQADRIVGEARAEAEESGAIVRRAVAAMGGIERSSSEIGEIITVIDGISFQTNLLALNAAVEATRAGAAGQAFAVIADEVRALAQRSAEAARDVKTRIHASAGEVDSGVALVNAAGAALERIIARIAGISELVSQIAASAGQQAIGLQQVNGTVAEMDDVTQRNAAMAEEATAAARSLSQEAEVLAGEVARFHLRAIDTGDMPGAAPEAARRPTRAIARPAFA